MCCIFTCFGWMIDLVQRVWTFAMSCCISSAICCVLMTSSLSGIALGYNYSLAEYIDLKETNVSVYLKRGVFDDEIADDMEWRRAGHLPVSGHLNEDNLITGAPDNEEMPLRSGRRLDDSVFDSNDHNKFEGSLMKLTAKPLDAPITQVSHTPDRAMGEIVAQQHNSLDQMKAIQGLLNMRRHNVIAATTSTESARRMMTAGARVDQDIPIYAMYPPPTRDDAVHPDFISGRRFDPHDPKLYNFLNPARTAVPDKNIGAAVNWNIPPAYATKKPTLGLYNEIYPAEKRTIPGPVPLNMGPIRPSTSVTSGRRMYSGPPVKIFTEVRNIPSAKDYDVKSGEETDIMSQKIRQEMSRQKSEDYPRKGDEDYELDAKGLPVRKKRHIDSISTAPSTTPSLPSSLDKSSKFSEVFNTETVFKTYSPLLLDKLVNTLVS